MGLTWRKRVSSRQNFIGQISTMTVKKLRKHNSDGLINWLRQPRLLCNQLSKSMRENIHPFIKSCGIRTVSSPRTASLALSADALVPCFLLTVGTISSWPKTPNPYPDLVPSGQFHHDQWVFVHLPGLAKNAAPRHGRQLIKPPGRYG